MCPSVDDFISVTTNKIFHPHPSDQDKGSICCRRETTGKTEHPGEPKGTQGASPGRIDQGFCVYWSGHEPGGVDSGAGAKLERLREAYRALSWDLLLG